MLFSVFAIFAVCISQIHAQMGGYHEITDAADLQTVTDLLTQVKSDLVTLLTTNGCDQCSLNDTLTVSSAEYQVVAGYNYRAHITIGDTSSAPEYDVQFFVPLAVNGTQQLPQNLQLYETTTSTDSPTTTSDSLPGGYHRVTDTDQLDAIRDLLIEVKSDVIALLNENGCNCSVSDTLSVLAAEYQVVAGYNYIAHIAIYSYVSDISTAMRVKPYDVQFFVPLPVNGTQQLPENLQLITTTTSSPSTTSDRSIGGYNRITDATELQTVYDYLNDVKSDLVDLLNENGCNGECSVDDTFSVDSAYYQVVAGYNYRAHITVGDSSEYDVQFYVPLPVNGVDQTPTNLQLFSWTTTDEPTTEEPTTTADRVVGGYHLITDADELQTVYDYLNDVKSDLIDLLNENGCNDACSVDDTFSVSSAYYQVVAGYNYRAHISIGDSSDAQEYDVQFYVPLPVNGVDQTPTNLQLFSWTTTGAPTSTMLAGGWTDVTDADDLAAIQELLDGVRQEVIALVNEYGCDECSVNDTFSVFAAQSQVVAGTNYRVLLGIGDFPDSQEFKLQFFVPLPINGVDQKPQLFQVLDSSLSESEDATVTVKVSAVYTIITVVVVAVLCCFVGVIGIMCCMLSKKKKGQNDKYNTLLDDHNLELSRPYSVENKV